MRDARMVRQQAGVRIERRDGQAVGRRHGNGGSDTRGLLPGAVPSHQNLSRDIFVKEQWVTRGRHMCFRFLPRIGQVALLFMGALLLWGMCLVACPSWNSPLKFPRPPPRPPPFVVNVFLYSLRPARACNGL